MQWEQGVTFLLIFPSYLFHQAWEYKLVVTIDKHEYVLIQLIHALKIDARNLECCWHTSHMLLVCSLNIWFVFIIGLHCDEGNMKQINRWFSINSFKKY
jgi:hypothetical protein